MSLGRLAEGDSWVLWSLDCQHTMSPLPSRRKEERETQAVFGKADRRGWAGGKHAGVGGSGGNGEMQRSGPLLIHVYLLFPEQPGNPFLLPGLPQWQMVPVGGLVCTRGHVDSGLCAEDGLFSLPSDRSLSQVPLQSPSATQEGQAEGAARWERVKAEAEWRPGTARRPGPAAGKLGVQGGDAGNEPAEAGGQAKRQTHETSQEMVADGKERIKKGSKDFHRTTRDELTSEVLRVPRSLLPGQLTAMPNAHNTPVCEPWETASGGE